MTTNESAKETTPAKQITTTNIRKGKEFDNVKALAEAVNTPLPKGHVQPTEYEKLYSLWSRYFEWEKIPNTRRIIITKIYRKPRPESEKKSTNSDPAKIFSSSRAIYQNDLNKLIIHELIMNPKHTIRESFPILIDEFGLSNEIILNDLSNESIMRFTLNKKSKLYLTYKRIIRSSLEYLKNNNVIKYKEDEIIVKENNQRKKANKKEREEIKKLRQDAYLLSLKNKSLYKAELIKLVHSKGWSGLYNYVWIKLEDDSYLDEKYILTNEEKKDLQKKIFSLVYKRVIEDPLEKLYCKNDDF